MVRVPLLRGTARLLNNSTGVYATSRHIPGVRFAGVTHPGLIGTAPSTELLAKWNEREGALIAAHGPDLNPPVALGPNPVGAYVGQDLDPKIREKIAREGARTIPGREHGGNCDVRIVHNAPCSLVDGRASTDKEPLQV
jgi:formamidase